MERINLEKELAGRKMEPRYMEYNWRDVALYALAVGAKQKDLDYVYEKRLKAIPTYGTIPYWGTINVRPYQWMPLPASMLATAPLLYLSGRITGAKVKDMLKPTLIFIALAWAPVLLITTYWPTFSTFLPNLFGYT